MTAIKHYELHTKKPYFMFDVLIEEFNVDNPNTFTNRY